MRLRSLVSISPLLWSASSWAWLSQSSKPTPSAPIRSVVVLSATNNNNSNNNDKEGKDDFEKRMALVRSLQTTFYSSPSSNSNSDKQGSNLDERTGKLVDLPLWRAPWWEVPGRSNVLNVHEAIYTNMFEQILYGPKPWCFGHLYLDGGVGNLKSDDDKYRLETWESTSRKPSSSVPHSAVLGCLMNISDYRRMSDGRLLLLVHAMERFVVTDVQQRLPYSIAEAQLLPDAEEIDPGLDFGTVREEELERVRAEAIQESVRFHGYEFDKDHVLPIPDRNDLDTTDITGSAIARVLPYCPFSKTLEPPSPCVGSSLATTATATNETKPPVVSNPLPSLEYRLLCQGIYQTPLVDPEFSTRQHLSTDELEYELWLAINNFLVATKTPVSPVLLGLLPPHVDNWPKGFALSGVVQDLKELESYEHDFVPVSPEYPAHRRQRRLSFSAAHLLEKTADVANKLRPLLLATPSTQQRLRLVLERFDLWQEKNWGEFQ